MTALQIVEFASGDLGVTLPETLVKRLGWKAGDEVLAVQTDQGISLSILCEKTLSPLEVGRRVMRERADVLRALAQTDEKPTR